MSGRVAAPRPVVLRPGPLSRALLSAGPYLASGALGAVLLSGGADAGLSPAGPVLLGVVLWTARHAGGRTHRLVLAVAAAVLVVPAVVLALAGRAPADAGRSLAWAAGAGAASLALTRSRREAETLLSELRRTERLAASADANLAAVASVARGVSTETDERRRVCVAAVEVAGATTAFLLEPDGRGNLVSTAIVGSSSPRVRVALDEEASRAVAAFRGARRTGSAVPPADAAERVAVAAGCGWVQHEPVPGPGRNLGVLTIGWPRRPELAGTTLRVVELLAAEAGNAVRRAELVAELRGLARTDPLTGLPNRRAWEELLQREMAYSRRSGQPLALALLDLDHFKAYNDRFGHQAGDRLLQESAASWRGQLREVDVLARWGGEEFVVLLPGCGLADAHALLDRLRGGTPGGQTCSAGVTVWDGREPVDALLRRADRALYAAKESGRDRVVSSP